MLDGMRCSMTERPHLREKERMSVCVRERASECKREGEMGKE